MRPVWDTHQDSVPQNEWVWGPGRDIGAVGGLADLYIGFLPRLEVQLHFLDSRGTGAAAPSSDISLGSHLCQGWPLARVWLQAISLGLRGPHLQTNSRAGAGVGGEELAMEPGRQATQGQCQRRDFLNVSLEERQPSVFTSIALLSPASFLRKYSFPPRSDSQLWLSL